MNNFRHILNSPLLNRRQRKKQPTESSDDEQGQNNNNNNNNNVNNNNVTGGEETIGSKQYRDLETFQKAQLRQKVEITISFAFFIIMFVF